MFIIAALTADGYIGLNEHHRATSWTTKADLHFFVRKTKEAGTVIMGRKTFATINKPLKDRRTIVLTSHPDTLNIEGVEATAESLPELFDRLAREGVPEVAICGGTSVYAQAMQSGRVNELYLTIMPKVFGQGLPLFGVPLDYNLSLHDTAQLDENTVLLHYRVD